MRLNGRRESNNVEDRRGIGGGTKLGLGGIVGVIVIALFTLLSGGNLGDVISNVEHSGVMSTEQQYTSTSQSQNFTPEEQELAKFSRQILAGTEDVWSKLFKQMGRTYTPPTLVIFNYSVQSACGGATSEVGPFYCSGDQKLYIDLSFFANMKKQLGADGDFAYAYVIAHEVGHHVEYLLGILQKAHEEMAHMDSKKANKISVKLELLADYYAGVWAHYDNQMFHSMDEGDLEEGLRCAEVIGDNYLQTKAKGYAQPETFTHGTSAQRMHWFKLGYETGDMSRTTFN